MAGMVETTLPHSATQAELQASASKNRLGLWIFLLSEVFLFGGIMVSRVVLWGPTRPELEQLPAFFLTSVLLLSSFFMNRAETAVVYGDRKIFLNGILATMILGIIFLFGVVLYEWPFSGLNPANNVYGAVFFLMTGMHALHVLSGVIFLGVIYRNGRKGLYSPQNHFAVEGAAVYWHFVDVVWIFFYPAIYLMGVPPL
jgi:cytochrome c oxidase subunit 3